MRLAFSSASSENPECAEKNRRLKGLRFIKAIVFYWICIFIEDYIIVALAIFLFMLLYIYISFRLIQVKNFT